MTKCQKCGLPQFDGAMGYVGPQCRCWAYFAQPDPNRPNQTREFVPVSEETVRRIVREELARAVAEGAKPA